MDSPVPPLTCFQRGDEAARGMVTGTAGFCAMPTSFTSEPFNSTLRYGYFYSHFANKTAEGQRNRFIKSSYG